MNRLSNSILRVSVFSYLLFAVWALYSFRESMSSGMLILTHLISLSYFASIAFLISVSSKKNFLLWGAGIAFSVFWLIQLKEIYLFELGDFFGAGVDIRYYERVAVSNINTGIQDFIQVLQRDISVDDWGFFSLMYLAYSFAGSPEGGRILMMIANTVAVLLSAMYLYRMLKILGLMPQTILFVVSIFLLSPFNFVITSVGLKENFFVLLIVLSLHSTIKFGSNKRRKHLFLAFLYAGLCFFFRPPVAGMLLITSITAAIITERNKNCVLRWGVILVVLALPFFDIVIQKAFGLSLGHLLSVTNYRFRNIGSAQTGWAINFIGALIGPFPNFTRSDIYGIYYSGVLLLKSFLGSFFYIGFYRAWKQKNVAYIPLMLYWLLNGSMYVLSGISLDYRYQITVFPAWLCFTAFGMDWYRMNKGRKVYYFILLYSLLVLLVIMFYNLRGLAND